MSEYHDGDVHDYFQEFNKACPYESAYISTHGILSVIPGVGRSERAFALAVANVVFSHALEFVRKYVQAAHRISPALKRYVSRLLTSTMRHAHMVSKAKIAYLRERTGEALRMAWQEDMKSYADRQKAEEAAKMRAERRAQIQKSISTILRFGWQRLDIRKGQIQVSLQLSGDENLDRSASVQVFERVRLHKANSVRRTGHSNIMKYYDDDDARDLHVPRVLFDANDGSECERERRRIPPLYEIEDFEASLAIQSRVRSRVARMLLERLRREKRRAARELREREDWERREQERLRHVTVHCDVEIRKSPFFLPYTAEKDITTSHARNQVDDKVKLSLFEPEHASIERGVHVLARFSGTGSKHWFSGTIFDDSRQPEVFGVEFDDGDVDAEVPRINIKIPRISEGDHVQSRVSDADAFVAARVVKVRPSETFDIRYQDGRVEHGIHRSRLKVPHIEEYMEIEAKNDRCRARREVMRAHRLNRERRLQETISASRMQQEKIRHRFIRACSVSPFDTLLQEQDDLDVESSSCVSYASALAEVARCVIETQQLMSPRCIVSVRITYTMVALRFGWSEVEGDQSIGVPYYFHRTSGETTWDRPHYDFQEHTAVRCIQDLVRKYLRRIQLSKALESSHLRALVRRTRDAAAQIAWTPSLQAETREQVPLELWMARRGFYHSAIASVLKCVDKQVRHATGQRKMNEANSTNAKKHALLDARCGVLRRLKRLSGGHFSNCVQRKSSQLSSDVPHEKATATLGSKLHQQQIRDEKLLEGVGLTDAADINWLRTTTDDVDSFIAYWTSSRDTRSMKEVLVNAKTKYTQELEAHYKNQRARCEHMAEILTQSKFPVTQGQLRRLCHDFAGKPAAAQEAINSTLLNVPTTSTRKTEVAALDVFMAGAKRCIQFVRKLRLRTLEVLFEKAFQAAENVRTAQEEDEANEMSSNAARACWILDDEIFSVVTVVLDGVVRHQAYTRRHLTMHKFRILLHARIHAATVCQMAWRSLIARRTLALYKAQQAADWHMLWDDSAQAFYFLQLSTLAVCWEEPEGGEWSYRPQVRDRYSQKLMLAWPQRDQPKALSLQQPSVGKCMVCKIEDSTRRCLSCQAPTFEGSLPIWGDGYFHFCFACFAAHHETSLTMRSHKFEVTKEAIAPPLRCCACNELATRRCRGLRLQPRGHEKLARLFLQHPFSGAANESLDAPHLIALDEKELLASLSGERLRSILRQAGIPLSSLRGEEIHQSCKCVVDKTDNHTDQLASYHTALQDALSKLASECNDVFCESCWSSTHSKGARLKHAWVGFAAGAAICALCEASIAIVKCDTCGDKLCAPCSAATHALGKNRNHQVEIYREEDATTYCGCCDRRQATETCSLCAETFCDSCLLFEHAATCPGRHGATAIAMGIATNYASKCVVCGRKPDTRCVECDELYCTWKGRQRCFGKAHARGKRREHTKVPYRALVDLEERLLQESVEAENRVKAAEERKARTVEENERERQNAIRFQQEKERQIDSKAQDVFVQQLLTEKRDERLPTSRWLRELASLRSAISRSSAIKRRL